MDERDMYLSAYGDYGYGATMELNCPICPGWSIELDEADTVDSLVFYRARHVSSDEHRLGEKSRVE